MASGNGVQVSKGTIYSTLSAPDGILVTKATIYTVLSVPSGTAVSKATVYSVLRPGAVGNLNTVVQGTSQTDGSLDAIVLTTTEVQGTLDTAVQSEGSITSSVDSVILSENTTVALLDAVIQTENSNESSLDTVIQTEESTTSSLDAVITTSESEESVTSSLDTVIQNEGSADSILDAVITVSGEESTSSTLDTIIATEESVDSTLDTTIGIEVELSGTLDAVISNSGPADDVIGIGIIYTATGAKPVDKSGGADPVVAIGSISTATGVNTGRIKTRDIQLTSAPRFSLALDRQLYARSIYQITSNMDKRQTPFVLVEREPKEKLTSVVRAVNYDERYYSGDHIYVPEPLPGFITNHLSYIIRGDSQHDISHMYYEPGQQLDIGSSGVLTGVGSVETSEGITYGGMQDGFVLSGSGGPISGNMSNWLANDFVISFVGRFTTSQSGHLFLLGSNIALPTLIVYVGLGGGYGANKIMISVGNANGTYSYGPYDYVIGNPFLLSIARQQTDYLDEPGYPYPIGAYITLKFNQNVAETHNFAIIFRYDENTPIKIDPTDDSVQGVIYEFLWRDITIGDGSATVAYLDELHTSTMG